jgi:hypothetical protein
LSTAPQLICKKNGECQITVGNRKKCKKCRYERCKASGMTQDAILDDGQVLIFRKKVHSYRRDENVNYFFVFAFLHGYLGLILFFSVYTEKFKTGNFLFFL